MCVCVCVGGGGDESEAVAPIIWLYQTVDARKEEVFFPYLLITPEICDTFFWYLIHAGIVNRWRLGRKDLWLDRLLYVVWFVPQK